MDPALASRLQEYVDALKAHGLVRSTRVEEAFRAVPRHLFLPGVAPEEAYSLQGFGITRSDGRPVSFATDCWAVAPLLEDLELEPGLRVLEIGAGSGYTAALIAHAVGPRGRVVTLDIEPELVQRVNAAFVQAGLPQARAVLGDGVRGFPGDTPYDRVIATTGAWDVPPAWIEQTRPGGRLFLPLQIRADTQRLFELRREGESLTGEARRFSQFTRMLGDLENPWGETEIAPGVRLEVHVDDRPPAGAAEEVLRLLGAPGPVLPLEGGFTLGDLRALRLWLAVREPGCCLLRECGAPAAGGVLPALLLDRFWGSAEAWGVLGADSLALLGTPPGQPPLGIGPVLEGGFELCVRGFGSGESAGRLVDEVRSWEAAGRPSGHGDLRIAVLPRGVEPPRGSLLIEKRWHRLAVEGSAWTRASAPHRMQGNLPERVGMGVT